MYNHPFEVEYYTKAKTVQLYANELYDKKSARNVLNQKQRDEVNQYQREYYEDDADLTLITYKHEKVQESLKMEKILYGDMFYNPYKKKIYIFGFINESQDENINVYTGVGFRVYNLRDNYFHLNDEEMELIDVLYDDSIMRYFNYIGNIYIHKQIIGIEIQRQLANISLNTIISEQKDVFIVVEEFKNNKVTIYRPNIVKFKGDFYFYVHYEQYGRHREIKEPYFKKIREKIAPELYDEPILLDSSDIFLMKNNTYIDVIKEIHIGTDYYAVIEESLKYYRSFITYIDEYGEIKHFSNDMKCIIPIDIFNVVHINPNTYDKLKVLNDDELYDKEYLKLLL